MREMMVSGMEYATKVVGYTSIVRATTRRPLLPTLSVWLDLLICDDELGMLLIVEGELGGGSAMEERRRMWPSPL